MPSFLRGFFSAVISVVNTVFWCLLLYPFFILKVFIPIPQFRHFCTRILVWIGEMWISGNDLNILLTQKIKWDIRLPQNLSAHQSYLVCSNHQAWSDIILLQHIFNRRIPFLRFFLKQELLYVPLLGGAWLALDYPFMKRYSKEYLEKHPEKRGQDLITTKRATEKFQKMDVSILNFLEGTRFTKSKHARQKSPFRHLLLPKAGGFAFVLEAMANKFQSILDVTIVYPQGVVNLWETLAGHLKEVVIEVREIPIPSELLNGNYLEDPVFRDQVQVWIRNLWQQKDERIERILKEKKIQSSSSL